MMNISIPIAATLIFNKSNTALRNFAHYLKPYYGEGEFSIYIQAQRQEPGNDDLNVVVSSFMHRPT